MQKTSKTVLVTGIGGNVGQGILRNIRTIYPDLRLVGTDIGRATAGHYFCDAFHQTPYCFDSRKEMDQDLMDAIEWSCGRTIERVLHDARH